MKQKENVDPNAATNGCFYFETIGYPRFDTRPSGQGQTF